MSLLIEAGPVDGKGSLILKLKRAPTLVQEIEALRHRKTLSRFTIRKKQKLLTGNALVLCNNLLTTASILERRQVVLEHKHNPTRDHSRAHYLGNLDKELFHLSRELNFEIIKPLKASLSNPSGSHDIDYGPLLTRSAYIREKAIRAINELGSEIRRGNPLVPSHITSLEPRSTFPNLLQILKFKFLANKDTNEAFNTMNPGIFTVLALSLETNSLGIRVSKEAKCIIDTGLLVGNIVSNDYLFNVLKYTQADIRELKTAESIGGMDIAGGEMKFKGAVYLTWYHANSPREFRDMRFLISQHSPFDLILGAQSVIKYSMFEIADVGMEENPKRSGPITLKRRATNVTFRAAGGVVGGNNGDKSSETRVEEPANKGKERAETKY